MGDDSHAKFFIHLILACLHTKSTWLVGHMVMMTKDSYHSLCVCVCVCTAVASQGEGRKVICGTLNQRLFYTYTAKLCTYMYMYILTVSASCDLTMSV